MSWSESKPVNNDLVSEIGKVIRNQKAEFRAGIEKHFFWTEHSATSAGEPRLSNTTGSARVFYGTESQVSAFRDGSLMVTSDTSRLYGVTSSSSVLLGSINAIVSDGTSQDGQPGTRHLIQTQIITPSLGDSGHDFPITYNSAPSLLIQRIVNADSEFNFARHIGIADITASRFTLRVEDNGGTGTLTVRYRSDGTVDLDI